MQQTHKILFDWTSNHRIKHFTLEKYEWSQAHERSSLIALHINLFKVQKEAGMISTLKPFQGKAHIICNICWRKEILCFLMPSENQFWKSPTHFLGCISLRTTTPAVIIWFQGKNFVRSWKDLTWERAFFPWLATKETPKAPVNGRNPSESVYEV
jgi:hypothetical protein